MAIQKIGHNGGRTKFIETGSRKTYIHSKLVIIIIIIIIRIIIIIII